MLPLMAVSLPRSLAFYPCNVIYLAYAGHQGYLTFGNCIIAGLYALAWYLLIYRWLGAKILATHQPKYPFTKQQLVRYVKTVRNHPVHPLQ